MKKYTVTGNVPPTYTSELPCFFVHCMLRFRCVVLVQDPIRATMLWYPTSHSISTGVIPWGMKLTTHLNRLPRLGIRADILLQPLYAFTVWIRKISFTPYLTLLLYYTENPFPSSFYMLFVPIYMSYTFQKITRSVVYITL
jgi:hypothetical protein